MLTNSIDIHNTNKELGTKNVNDKIDLNSQNSKLEEIKEAKETKEEPLNINNTKCPCPIKQLLAIIIPITVVVLFVAIFVPIYVIENDKDDDNKVEEEFDEFIENQGNETYASLTPKSGYDNIFIFLGGITESPTKYFEFFESKNTFIPKGTKIYFISGQKREMQYMIDYGAPKGSGYEVTYGWFNLDSLANLCPNKNDYSQAIESKILVLDAIDRIKQDEKIDYSHIYLGGFSQGAVMVNYILLNSRHELGGYLAFSGFIFDELFPSNSVVKIADMTDDQKNKLNARKDYHIIATHSFKDNRVFYNMAIEGYYTYFETYTDFSLHSFGNLDHQLIGQPTHPIIKKWLKERMNK